MSVFSKLGDMLGGSLFKEIKETAMAYFPPDMSPQDKAAAEIAMEKVISAKTIEANKVLAEASAQLDKRIAEQEGTAKDLLGLPVLGRLIIFLRGLQRPAWGFGAMYMDYQWFFSVEGKVSEAGQLIPMFSEQQQTAMIIINVLVLGFLFGERTIKNLEPLIIKVFAK